MTIAAQNTKTFSVVRPAAIVNDGSFTTVEIDTVGFEYCQIFCHLGATDIAMTALKVQESDESGANFSDVTGLVYGTSTDIAGSTSSLPSATDDNSVFVFDIDLRTRERYLDLVATAGNGSNGIFMSSVAVLSRSHDGLVTATERGAANILRTT